MALIFFVLGTLLASFTTVITERVYTGQSWSRGRSRCNSCGKVLTTRDLIPMLSYVLSGGRCRHCGSRLPVTYLIGEAVLGSLFAWSYIVFGLTVLLPAFLVVLTILFFIVLYDLRHTIVLPLASLLLFLGSLIFAILTSPSLRTLGLSIICAAGISLFLFLVHALSRGRAMGLGDAPIAFSLALLVGSTYAFTGLLFSFWIGAVVGIVILLGRRGGPTMGIEVPFVPFLALGFLLAYFTQWNPFPLFVL